MINDQLLSAHILIIDDESGNILLLNRILSKFGFNQIMSIQDPRQALQAVTEYQPDIILLDLMMPYLDGITLINLIKSALGVNEYLPILVLTADIHEEAKRNALSAGAHDFLTKPFDITEVLLRINNLLTTRFLHQQLRKQNGMLEEKIRERTYDLNDARQETLERLARAAEYRDDDTGIHTQRVGYNSALIAKYLGWSPDDVETIRHAAPLHDIGKIGIADLILLKPGKLTAEEFNLMKSHTIIGANILSGSKYAVLRMGAQIARSHHERWDGTGYPDNLRGDSIPYTARIVTVVDVFDALIHERPYKAAWSYEMAINEIKISSGSHCDPDVVEAFVECYEKSLIDI